MGTISKLMHAWNAFNDEENNRFSKSLNVGGGYGSSRPDRARLNVSNERSIISAIYTRLAIDFASVAMRHVRLDDNDRFKEELDTGLNNCLTLFANVDQSARAFRQDLAMTLFDKGQIAIVPVDTSLNPNVTGGYDIQTMRIGHITHWYPQHVRASVYNEKTGMRQEILCDKKVVAIIENPLYSIMNEPNSTLQRLIRKLNLLDAVDEQTSSGKLDLIFQVPYAVKNETRRQLAEKRREEIEFQLKGSKYGIAWTDGTEKITQLNRPAENNLWKQIVDLKEMLYTELGVTPEILNGTADEQAMLNYNNRTIKPLLDEVVDSMKRVFLTKTARSQKQSIVYFRDPFALVPVNSIADIADKLSRNEIMSSNEWRAVLGLKPSTDPKADELRNSNMPAPSEPAPTEETQQEGDSQNGT